MLKVQQYELTYILGEKTNPEIGKKKMSEVKIFIEKAGGNISKEELWGHRELAYAIKRNHIGFYTTLWFSLDVSGLKPLEQHLNFDEDIIRSLITKAYTSAQPGTLYPVNDDEKTEKDSASTAEEMLRRKTSSPKGNKKTEAIDEELDSLPEEERLKKLDESLEELLKNE